MVSRMHHPKLSVVVPVYNAESFIRRCVYSIIAQTYSPLEIILVNDGSRDNSLQLCDELASSNSKIRVIDQLNSGPNAARNRGIEAATGEFITFVDADDEFYSCDTLTQNMLYFINPEIDIVSFPQYVELDTLDNVGAPRLDTKREQFTPQILSDKRYIITNWYNGKLIAGHFPGKIFRKSLFDGWKLIETIRFTEDHYNIPDLCDRARKIQISGVGGYIYKLNPDSAIHSEYTPEKRRGQLFSEVRLCNYLHRLGNLKNEESSFYYRALENAYYLQDTKYEKEAILKIETLSRPRIKLKNNLLGSILFVITNLIGYKQGFDLVKKLIRVIFRK